MKKTKGAGMKFGDMKRPGKGELGDYDHSEVEPVRKKKDKGDMDKKEKTMKKKSNMKKRNKGRGN